MGPIITLTTDFGLDDAFVGVMKGVILSIAPEARIVDLCHGVTPQDIAAGALALESAVGYFPTGTIHVGVVDPGVGSERAAIAIQTERGLYVGPDNGLFTLALQRDPLIKAVRLTNRDYQAATVSHTFHGRDVFAPAAAHLALGVALDELGESIHTPAKLDLPEPEISDTSIEARTIHADRFGNLITNLTENQLGSWLSDGPRESIEVKLGGSLMGGISNTFSDQPPGEPAVYMGSGGRVEIAVRNGSALNRFGKTAALQLSIKP